MSGGSKPIGGGIKPKTGASLAKKNELKLIADNKKARFDYKIEDTYEAGLQLMGSELKSIRAGQVNLKDSYVSFANGEAFLQNAHISVYQASSYMNHEPERLRKLLLHKAEVEEIERAVAEQGMSCVALKMYFKGNKVKLEIATAKGKNHGDRRATIKERDVKREISKEMSRGRKR